MRNKVYYGCGFAMVIFLVLAALDMIVPYLSKAAWLQQYHPLTWLEILSVEAFGIAWFVKGETFGILKDKEAKSVYNGKTRMVASTLGVLAGAVGIIHGLLEILQGNGVPGGIYTFAIGSPCQPNSTWYSCLPIITIIPHYYWISGILAIIIGTLIVIAAAAFVQKEYGGLALILLSILQLLFGGGYISPFLCLIAGLVATRTQDSFTWWTTNPTFRWQRYLAKLWPWSWIFPVIPVAVYIIPGFRVNEFMPIWFILTIVITLGLLLLTIFSAFAYDIQQRQNSTQQAPSVAVEFPPT